jgi:hypothetical protein
MQSRRKDSKQKPKKGKIYPPRKRKQRKQENTKGAIINGNTL